MVAMLSLTEILQNIVCPKLLQNTVQQIPQVANDVLAAVICIGGSVLIQMLREI
jgi:hypothetical protein